MTPFLPRWDIKTLELVGFDVDDVSSICQTRNQKHQANVSLMTQVLDTCDPNTYVDDKGQPKWEKAMSTKMDSLLNNHTWDLIPRL